MRKIYYIVLLSFLSISARFDSLPELVSYADQHEEYPMVDNDDWSHPDFSDFYDQTKASRFSFITDMFGLSENAKMIKNFEQMLEAVTKQRSEKEDSGAFARTIHVGIQDRMVIFGDLQGAFHSFVRDLQELSRLKIITEDLRVQGDNYLVFNGNVINASAYNLQTLLVILTLMKKNPDRVIYIKGPYENKDVQQQLSLYQQLKHISSRKAEKLLYDIASFFDTLPFVLYFVQNGQAVKISAQQNDGLLDQMEDLFLPDKAEASTDSFAALSNENIDAQVEVNIIPSNFSRTLGLSRYVGPPMTWTVLSSPTGAHRRLYSFFNDAFAIIDASLRFENWTISLYYNDLRTLEGFKSSGLYNLASGILVSGEPIDFFDSRQIDFLSKELAEKKETLQELKAACKETEKLEKVKVKQDKSSIAVQDGVLVLGSTLDLSKGLKDLGQNYKASLVAAFSDANEVGGAHGVQFRNVVLDDHYEPKDARQNILKLLNEIKTDLIFLPVGTPTLKASLDLIKDGKVLVLFPTSQSSIFRQSDLKYIINSTASYFEQGKALIDYVFKQAEPKKIAIFYQNDDSGKDVLNGAKEAIKKYATEAMLELPYNANQVGFSEQKKKILSEDPDVIIFASTPIAGLSLIKDLGINLLSEKRLLGISDMGEAQAQDFVKSKGLTLAHANVWPSPIKSDIPLVKKFRMFAQEHNLPLTSSALEAYVNVQIFLYLLEQIDGSINKESIIKAAENIKNVEFGGFSLNFNPQTRVLENSLWINPGDGSEWFNVSVEVPQESKEAVLKADEEPVIAVKKDVIILGNSSDFSKGIKAFADSLKSGIQLKIDQVNEKGGIKDRQLRMMYLDDGYQAEKAAANVKQLLDTDQTDLFLLNLGTPTLKGYLDLIRNGDIFLFFPYTGAHFYRKPDLVNLIHYRPSYAEALAEVAKYIAQNFEARTFLLFYQESLGTVPADTIKQVLKDNFNITDVRTISYVANDLSFSEKVQDIKEYDPDAIAFIGPPISAHGLIRQIGVNALAGKKLFGLSALEEKSFTNFVKEKGLEFILPNILPDVKNSDTQLAKEFREASKNTDVKVDQAVFEAYFYTDLTAHILDKIEGEITKEKIIAFIEQMNNYDYKGITLNFDPQTRTLSDTVWINAGNDAPWEKVTIERLEAKVKKKVKQEKEGAAQPEPKEEKTALGITNNNVTFGSTLDLSKGIKDFGIGIKQGTELFFNRLNEQGGVDNRRFVAVFLDDGYTPNLAKKNIEAFLKEKKTQLILSPTGTQTLVSYISLVENGKVLVLFPIAGTDRFRNPALTHIINFRASYSQEIKALTEYMIQKKNNQKFVLFYQSDDFGIQTKQAAQKALQKHGIKDILEVSYNRNDVNFKKHAEKIRAFDPEVIAFIATPIATQEIIRNLGIHFFTDKDLYGISDLTDVVFQNFIKRKGLTVFTSNIVPNPHTSDIEIAQEFRAEAEKNNIMIGSFAFEGYINAALAAYIIDQVEGEVSVDAIIQAAQNIKNVDFKGLKLNFNEQTRELSSQVWLSKGDGSDWVELMLKPEEDKGPESQDEKVSSGVSTVKPEEDKELESQEEKVALGVTNDTITFGSTLDLSKGVKDLGLGIKQGTDLYVDRLNKQGGIDDRRFKVMFLDDEYTPDIAKNNVDRFLKDIGTQLVLSPVGTPTLVAYLDLVKDEKVLVLFPQTGSVLFRDPALTHIINFRASYSQEAMVTTKYMIEEKAAERFVIFYQNDGFGIQAKEAARAVLQQHNIENVLEVPYDRNDVKFKKHAEKIRTFKPDTIAFISTAIATQELIRSLGVIFFSDKYLYGISVLSGDFFQSFVKEKGLNLLTSSVVPNPHASDVEIAQEFRKDAKDNNTTIGGFSFEGYINAALAAYLINQIDGDITVANIIQAAENIKDVDFKGLKLNFNKDTRELSSHIWLSKGDGSAWTEVAVTSEVKQESKQIAKGDKVLSDEVKTEKKDEAKVQEQVKSVSSVVTPEQAEQAAIANKKPMLAVHDDQIIFGSTVDLEKGLKNQGVAIQQSLQAKENLINRQGGINGKSIDILIVNDDYDPIQAAKNINTFLSRKETDLILSSPGTPTLEAYLDLVKNGTLLVLFPLMGSQLCRDSQLKNIINFRVSYAQEIKAATQYMIDSGASKFVLVYQDDTFGKDLLKAAQETLKENNVSDMLELAYNRNNLNFTEQAKQIKAYKPDTIAFLSTSIATQGLIRQIGVQNLSDKKMYGNSDLGEGPFQSFIQSKGLHIYVPNVVPDPHNSDIEIAKEFRKVAKNETLTMDTVGFEAYINAALAEYLISKVDGQLTKEKIIKVAEGIKDETFKGLKLNFDPQVRELSYYMWLSKGDGSSWTEVKTKD